MNRSFKLVRVLCLMLAVVLSVAMFAGCKGDGDSASSKDDASKVTTSMENTEIVEQYEDQGHPTLPKTKDLGGYEVTFACPYPTLVIPEEGETAEEDLILEALKETEKAYNCKILVKQMPYNDPEEVVASISAGEQYANVIMPVVFIAGAFLQTKLCADMLQKDISQYIDMKQPWWNDTMAYASNVLGSVYAGAPSICSPADYTFIVYFNKNICDDVGIDSAELYKLWKDGKWTWDEFVKYAKMAGKDIDGNGVIDNVDKDRFGYIGPGYDSIQAFSSSAKVASITTTNGMNPTYTFNTPHAITTLTRLNQLFTTDNIYGLGSWDGMRFLSMFSNGNALFLTYKLETMRNDAIRDMSDDWGILPMPKGPKEGGGWQDKYMSRVDHNYALTMIPATVEDKASTALILESMAFNYFKIINKKIETYATLYCRDDESVEVANSIYNTSTFEISQFLYGINNGSWNSNVETLVRDVVRNPAYDVSGAVNAPADLAQQMINDYFNGV